MNKSDLKAHADAVISDIGRYQDYCRESSELAELIKLPYLLTLKASLQHNFLIKLAGLPDEMPSSPAGEESPAIDDIRATYNYLNKTLLGITQEYRRSIKNIERISSGGISDVIALLKKKRFDELGVSITRVIAPSTTPHRAITNGMIGALTTAVSLRCKHEPKDAYGKGIIILEFLHKFSERGFFSADGLRTHLPSYPLYYSSDKAFAAAIAAINAHRAGFDPLLILLASEIKSTSVDNCQRVIGLLEHYYQQDERHCSVAHERYGVLVASQKGYNDSVAHKRQFLIDTYALRSFSAEDLRVIHSHDEGLGENLRGFHQNVTRWCDGFEENSERIFTKARVADVAIELHRLAQGHEVDIGAFIAWHRKLSGQVEGLRHKMTQGIAASQKSFQHIYAGFKPHYLEYPKAADSIRRLKAEFDEVSAIRADDGDCFSHLAAKSQRLLDLTQRSTSLLGRLTKEINAHLQRDVVALKTEKDAKIDQIVSLKQREGFLFNAREEDLFKIVISYRIDRDSGAAPDYAMLSRKHRVQSEQLLDVKRFEEMMVLHQLAKGIVTRNDIEQLTRRVNEEPDAAILLSVIGQYVTEDNESTFLAQLSDNLHSFHQAKLPFIKSLVSNKESDEARQIRRKLAFMDLGGEQGTNFNPRNFLRCPNAISAAVLLEELGLRDLLTNAILENSAFCDAVQVLTRIGTPMDAGLVRRLVLDTNKCEIICQHEVLYQDRSIITLRSRLSAEIYKALIEDFLKTDENVARAVNKIKLAVPEYCTPLLLVLIKEHEKLRTLLCDDPHKLFQYNLPFLMPILKRLTANPMAPRVYLENYLSSRITPAGRGYSDMRRELPVLGREELYRACFPDRRDEQILVLLRAANQPSIDRTTFKKMSKLMTRLNEFVDDRMTHYAQPEEKEALTKFRRDAVFLLLGNESVEKKKVNFEKLAYKHFKHPNLGKNILLDILQFITGLFLIVMPIRLLCGHYALFSHAKSHMHQQASSQLDQALREPLDRSTSNVP